MNFVSQRVFSGLRRINPLTISQFAEREKVCLFINYTGSIHVRSKMKVVNPGVFAVRKTKNENSWDEHNNPYGLYGCLLLGIPIVTFILGTWQVQRRQWKLGLIEDLQRSSSSEPQPLPKNLDDLASLEYHPIRARGRFLHDKEILVGPRSLILNGQAASENSSGLISHSHSKGYWLVTPFKLEDRDLTILVNRGWVPDFYKNIEKRKELNKEGVTDVVGLVRLNEERTAFVSDNVPERKMWQYRDLDQMAEYTGSAPVFLDQLANKSQSPYPIGGQTRLSLRNEHFTYAVTWYGISAVTAIMWYRIFLRKTSFLKFVKAQG